LVAGLTVAFGALCEASDVKTWIGDGKLILNERLRYEFVDQDGLLDANAITLRSRIGWQTADSNGWVLGVDFEDVRALNEDDYNMAGLNPGGAGRAVVADVETTELNQGFVSYSNEGYGAKIGRQRIVLDDARFVGNVGWRQNEQTYDAAMFSYAAGEIALKYAYIDRVNRIFGDDHPAGNFNSESHILNASFAPGKTFKVVGYGYFLEFDDAAALSSDTIGLRVQGSADLAEGLKLNYFASYARQSDNGSSPAAASYDSDYIAAEGKFAFSGVSLGIGYELLGSDNGVSFKTPLATLHKFNGWADVFLGTPGSGLQDMYAVFGVKLGSIPITVVYHDFESDVGGTDFGSEIDFVVSRKFTDGLTGVFKFADYSGESGFASRTKATFQFDFSY